MRGIFPALLLVLFLLSKQTENEQQGGLSHERRNAKP